MTQAILPAAVSRPAMLGRVARVLLMLIAIAATVARAMAQVPTEQARANADAAISALRSPFCPGLMLEVCPSPDADALRDSIRERAQRGESADQIVESVVARYGEEWRAVPRRRGAGLAAWLFLPVALGAGGVLWWTRIRAMRVQGPASTPAADVGMTAEEHARLAAALRELDGEQEPR